MVYRKLLANSIVSPYGCCVPYVRKNVFLAMMGVFCAVSGVSICELAIFLVRKTRASVTVPHMGLFYVALCLLHVVNRVAPKNSPFARYRIWSGPVCDIPHMEWSHIRHTAYGVPDAKSAICDIPYMADGPYGTYCPFSEFWRITLKIRIWMVPVCKRLGG